MGAPKKVQKTSWNFRRREIDHGEMTPSVPEGLDGRRRREAMHTLKLRLQEMKPAFILFYLSFMGFMCAVSAQMYLKIRFDPVICLCFTGLIFGIYTFNRFTDATEDFANDIGKFLFFQ